MSVTGDGNGVVVKVARSTAAPVATTASAVAVADAERLLDKAFENVRATPLPAGASRLELGVSVSSLVRVELTLQAEGAPSGKPAASLPESTAQVQFGPKGHGTIAILAMKDLETRAPAVKQRVDAILGEDPDGRTDYFVATNWADAVRNDRPETAPWHFVDFEYRPDDPDATPPVPPAPTVLTAIAEMSDLLRSSTDPKEKADALCFVMHLVGDLHQPLHCCTRVTPQNPHGDRGGNNFRLSGQYKKLHSLWDDSINLSLPDSAEELAVAVADKHPRDTLSTELAVKEPEAWARATYALAIEYGYRPLEGQGSAPTPTNAYLRRARDVAQRQAALGGYRLSDLLVTLLG